MTTNLKLENYVFIFREVLARNNVEMIKSEIGDGLIVEYALCTANKTQIGEINCHGFLTLGDMNIHVESEEGWCQWKEEKYPNVSLEDAFNNEIDKALAGKIHWMKLFGSCQRADAEQLARVERQHGVGKF